MRPGSLVIDIGANIGAFSLPIASDVGEGGCVVAIEPTDYAFTKLVRNAELNPGIASRLIAVQARVDRRKIEAGGQRILFPMAARW